MHIKHLAVTLPNAACNQRSSGLLWLLTKGTGNNIPAVHPVSAGASSGLLMRQWHTYLHRASPDHDAMRPALSEHLPCSCD
jgi:hypothetical protein